VAEDLARSGSGTGRRILGVVHSSRVAIKELKFKLLQGP
jgi:hypothetical protein